MFVVETLTLFSLQKSPPNEKWVHWKGTTAIYTMLKQLQKFRRNLTLNCMNRISQAQPMTPTTTRTTTTTIPCRTHYGQRSHSPSILHVPYPWHGIPCRLLIVQQANNPMKQPANVDLHRRTTNVHQATTTSPSDPLKFKVATSGCSKWQCRRTNDDARTLSHSPCPPDPSSVYVVADAKNSFPFDEEDSCAVVIVVVCSFLYLIQLCLCRHFCLQQQ